MALNEPSVCPLLEAIAKQQGYQMALNVAGFGEMPGTIPLWAKTQRRGLSGLMGGMKGGIDVGSVVDLASGPRSRLGKERKKKKTGEKRKKEKSSQDPGERFSTAATNRRAAVNKRGKKGKERKKRGKYVFHCVLKTGSGDCGLFERQH